MRPQWLEESKGQRLNDAGQDTLRRDIPQTFPPDNAVAMHSGQICRILPSGSMRQIILAFLHFHTAASFR